MMDDTTKYLIELSSQVAGMSAKLDSFISRIEAIEGENVDKCKDCEVARRLDDHLTQSDKGVDRGWMIAGILIAAGLSMLGILLQVFHVI